MKNSRWQIVFEDDHLIIINKPAYYLTLPDRYDQNIPNLLQSLQQYRDQIFVNHRLDKNTSGLICFTKTEKAHKAMSQIFEKRLLDKHYLAIVHGTPAEDIGLIELGIKYSKSRKRMILNESVESSLTKYRILESWNIYSLLELKLITGKMHQIRAHLEAIGNPILADEKYGISEAFYLSEIKRKYNNSSKGEERPLISRQALHSFKLAFEHPFSGEKIDFESDPPKDMRATISQMKKCLTD